jgi:hypothetical protein
MTGTRKEASATKHRKVLKYDGRHSQYKTVAMQEPDELRYRNFECDRIYN